MKKINNHNKSFEHYLSLTTEALKLQNEAVAKNYEQKLVALLGIEYTTDILTAAILQLSETEPRIFCWTLENLAELEACYNLLQDIIKIAVSKLLSQGFSLGQDFSVTHKPKLLIKPNARESLLKSILPTDQIFFEVITKVIN